MKLLILALIFCTTCHGLSTKPKIGIVGAGIGGTSCAHYLRELFGADVEIDMYESGPVGGRLATVNIEGTYYESGGSVIHPANAYMVNFTHMLGLKARDELSGRLGLYDGKEIVFESSEWTFLTPLQLLWRYGWDIPRIDRYVRELINDFGRIYEHQNQGYAFTTVENLLTSMSSRMVELLHESTKEALKKDGFGDLFIAELVRGGMRTNYGQSENINGFVGSVSMAGIQPGLWSVYGGNKRIPEELLLRSKVNLFRSKVTTVTLTSPSPNTQYDVQIENHDGSTEDKTYDIFIIAAPLNNDIAGITFKNFPQEIPTYPPEFHTTYATFLKGVPNAQTFGLDNVNDFPSALFTTTEDTFFSSIGRHQPVDYKTGNDYNSVYKVFSNTPLSKTQLHKLFTSFSEPHTIEWRAYPEYDAEVRNKAKVQNDAKVRNEAKVRNDAEVRTGSTAPFLLHEAGALYYVNAIEAAAACMEMSAIGGRNVALLAHSRWIKSVEKVDSVEVLRDASDRVEL